MKVERGNEPSRASLSPEEQRVSEQLRQIEIDDTPDSEIPSEVHEELSLVMDRMESVQREIEKSKGNVQISIRIILANRQTTLEAVRD